MLKVFLFSLIFSLPAGAAAPAAKDPNFRVTVNPAAYPVDAFRREGFRTDSMDDRATETEVSEEDALLTPNLAERDAAFASVEGVAAVTNAMDELDRDILFTRARSLEPAALAAYYEGRLSPAQLSRLREAVRKVTLLRPLP